MKTALVCGAGGFIGGHLVRRLKRDGFWVRGVDRRRHEFAASEADEFAGGDLRDARFCGDVIDRPFDEVYQLAAEMGGAEFVYAGKHDAEILHNSMMIDLNVLASCEKHSITRIFFASSACVYPQRNQQDPKNPDCSEDTVYPAEPDSEYGWTKLFGERLYLAHARCRGLQPRIARYHNVFGPENAWTGGREKAPAALCRKVIQARDGQTIDIFGDGLQSRSFLFIAECIEGTIRLMRSDVSGPLNIGSEELITINGLADAIIEISGKTLHKRHVPGSVGVRGRNSNNTHIREKLGWAPSQPLRAGLEQTYAWIESQVLQETQVLREAQVLRETRA
jgi:GDP-D-mannose 3',5'-epimerase